MKYNLSMSDLLFVALLVVTCISWTPLLGILLPEWSASVSLLSSPGLVDQVRDESLASR